MMDRPLKERIIGAIILVVFAVLVVPVFLNGPPEEGEIVSERVLLPGQEGQDVKTVVLDRERSDPMPVTNEPTDGVDTKTPLVVDVETSIPVEKIEAEPVAARVEQEPAPEPKPKTPTPAVSSTGMWVVQLGSFSNKENAEKLAAELRKQGYAAFLSQLTTSSGQLHRVRIGPQKDRESAEAMAARLLKVGHKGQVLPHP